MANLYHPSNMIATFIYDPADCDGRTIILKGPEAHHLAAVLRMKPGETVRLIDGRGMAYLCEIKETESKRVECNIIESIRDSGEPLLDLTLAIGLSTGFKFDLVVEKGTEVGVSRFIPLVTSKGKIKRVELDTMQMKIARWRRIAESAAKQSGRSVVPIVDPPQALATFIQTCLPQDTLLFHPGGTACNSVDCFGTISKDKLTLLVGPESGFSPEEIALVESRRIPIVGLGERVLRTETAGIVLSAVAIYSHEKVNTTV
ncbi:MAG: RsmE family RNA methyltransferase [candidate division Zixibacteria bacterium]|nr:RsmE family RNA methyltransferase [candidate division Zixibacteria bacterium]